ncbi:uncharacterized protein LOC144576666 isoform X3 [Callithrix jacchus]
MSWDKGERGESIVKRKFITFLRNILLSLQQSDFWPVEKKTVNYYYWMDTDAFKRVLISIFCHGEYPIKLEVKQVKNEVQSCLGFSVIQNYQVKEE